MRDWCDNELVGCCAGICFLHSVLVMYTRRYVCCLYFLRSLHLKWSEYSSCLSKEKQRTEKNFRKAWNRFCFLDHCHYFYRHISQFYYYKSCYIDSWCPTFLFIFFLHILRNLWRFLTLNLIYHIRVENFYFFQGV